MCVCARASVPVCLPIKGDSRFGGSLDSCCLLCSLRGDEQMVCWSVVRRTHAGPHTHTQTQTRTCMLYPVTLALSPIYLFHCTSLGRTMPLCVCVCAFERGRKDTRQFEWSGKASLWGGHRKKLMTHSHIGFGESLLFTRQPLCIQQEFACNAGIVFTLLICPCPGNKNKAHLDKVASAKLLATAKTFFFKYTH